MNFMTRYFDSLTAAMFKIDDKGRTLFFPAGIWSKGRVIGDEAAAQRLRAQVRRAFMLFFLVGIPLLVVASRFAPDIGIVTYIVAGAVVGLLFNGYTLLLGRGLERTEERISLREAHKAQAFALGKGWLRALAIGSGVLAAGCGAMAILASGAQRWEGVFGLLFFTVCLVVFMIQLRKLRAGEGTRGEMRQA